MINTLYFVLAMQSQIPANRVNDQKEHHSIAIYEIIHPDDREYCIYGK